MANNNAREIAKKMTVKTAAMKDYKIRNKHNRAMREIARNLECGYIEATADELAAKYPECYNGGGEEKMVWGISLNLVWKEIEFTPVAFA